MFFHTRELMYLDVSNHTTHSFFIVYYMVTSFNLEHRLSGHYTKTCMLIETMYHKVGDLPKFLHLKCMYSV